MAKKHTISVKFEKEEARKPTNIEQKEGSLEFMWDFPRKNFVSDERKKDDTGNDESESEDQYYESGSNTSYKASASETDKNSEDDTDEFGTIIGNGVTGRKHSLLKKVVLPIVLALLIGNLIGYVALVLVNRNSEDVSNFIPTETVENAVVPASANVQKYYKELHVFLIQGGVFSSTESLLSMEQELGENFAKMSVEFDDKHYLFVGVIDDLDKSRDIARKMTDETKAFYWKEVMFDGETRESFSEDQLEKIKESRIKFLELIKIVGEIKLGKADSGVEFSEIDITNSGGAEELLTMYNKCLLGLKEYRTSPEEKKLIDIEQSLLNYVTTYHKL